MNSPSQRWYFNSAAWTPSQPELSFCISLLPQHQQDEVTSFFKIEDQKRALISRLMQRMLVHQLLDIPINDVCIFRTKEGKPYVENLLSTSPFTNLNFSVSHHGDYVALASEAGCLVGLDIMAAGPEEYERPFDYLKNFESYFTPLEWINIISAGPDLRHSIDLFNRYWSMKESYIKATGAGLMFDLRRAEFVFEDNNIWSDVSYLRLDGVQESGWSFRICQFDKLHWVTVAQGPLSAATDSFKKTLNLTQNTITTTDQAHFSELRIEDLIPYIGRTIRLQKTIREDHIPIKQCHHI